MSDRNTRIKRNQLAPIRSDDLDAINVPEIGQVPALGSGGQFEWVDMGGHTQNTDTILKKVGGLILDQSQLLSDANYSQVKKIAQTFKIGITGQLSRISLILGNGNLSGNLTIDIVSLESSGLPSEEVLQTKTFSNLELPESPIWVDIDLDTPIEVTAEEEYAIVIYESSGTGWADVLYYSYGEIYLNGQMYYWHTAEWVQDDYESFAFKTYVTSETEPADLINDGTLKDDLLVDAGKKIGTKTIEEITSAVDLKHTSGSDNQNASEVDTEDSGISVQEALNTLETDKVDKITDYSLVADTEIAKIHSPNSDDQIASTVPTDETGVSVQDALNTLEANFLPYLTENKNYYVATYGDDDTGEGSVGNPYETYNKVLTMIPKNINGYTVTIYSLDGQPREDENVVVKGFYGGGLLKFDNSSGLLMTTNTNPVMFFQDCYLSVQVIGGYYHIKADDIDLFEIINCPSILLDVMVGSEISNSSARALKILNSNIDISSWILHGDYKISMGFNYDSRFSIAVVGSWAQILSCFETISPDPRNGMFVIDGSRNWLRVNGDTASILDDYDVAYKKYVDDNAGANNASELPTNESGISVQDHIDDTGNPHSVTKAQVGLTNVTDDVQLKENISSYDEKVTPHDDDLLLLEDSEETGTPIKKVKKSNIVPIVDDFTIINNSGTLKVADRIEGNIMLLAFYRCVDMAKSFFNLIDGFIDEYEDETGIDTVNSINEDYDSSNDLYSPNKTLDDETKMLLHGNGTDLSTNITDEIGKTVTNNANYDAYTKLCSKFDGADEAQAYTDPIAGAYTFYGTAQLDTAQKKFGTASLLLDGDSDYVTMDDSADWDFGTGDFTVDWWERRSGNAGEKATIARDDITVPAFILGYTANGSYASKIYMSSDGVSFDIASAKSLGTAVVDTWMHYAVVRSGNNFYAFQNGILTDSWTSASGLVASANPLQVGRIQGGGGYFNGYIDGLRISKGIARWTTNFTPPVAPYGQVVISTAQKKFGTGSLLFDGSGSYCTIADSADWDFGTGDFTIDGWVRFNAIGVSQTIVSQTETVGARYWFWELNEDNKLRCQFFSATGVGQGHYIMTSVWGLSTNTWYHIAMVRSGTTCKMFINGVSQTLTETIAFGTNTLVDYTDLLNVGRFSQYAGTFFNGYIDELRISKGIARWTTNFTPPTQEYPFPDNMTLISNDVTAEAEPTQVRVVIFEEDVDAITINTDLKLYVSIDNGANYDQITLADEGDWETGKRILSGIIDVTARTGTAILYKITTHNNKDCKIHGTAVSYA